LLGERESDLEPLPHLIYGEVGDPLRHLDAGRLRWSLHTTARQEDRCQDLRKKNQWNEWNWEKAVRLFPEVIQTRCESCHSERSEESRSGHSIYRLRS